ncbi:MAG: 30S ribosomal protein S6 [Patescibacteria group bacterium]
MEDIKPASTYELTILMAADLSELDVQKVMDKIKATLTAKNGLIQKEYDWGKKRLAYHINKVDFGYYHSLVFEAPKEVLAEIGQDLRLMPDILRYLIISLDKEGITADQLFTPDKEAALVASMMKEKMEPARPHQTRASRGRATPIKTEIPKVEDSEATAHPSADGTSRDNVVEEIADKTPSTSQSEKDKETKKTLKTPRPDHAKATTDKQTRDDMKLTKEDEAKRREELDKKLDELLKEE